MREFPDTREIFAQLADTDGSEGVRTIIENHDAWLANSEVMGRVTAAMRAHVSGMRRDELAGVRIREQAERLAGLVTKLRVRRSSVG